MESLPASDRSTHSIFSYPRTSNCTNLTEIPQRLVSLRYPATDTYYKDFLLKFIYEETPLPQFQSDFAALLAHDPMLYDYFSIFFMARVSSTPQQAAAKQYFCALTGLPNESPRRTSHASMDETSMFTKAVQVIHLFFHFGPVSDSVLRHGFKIVRER